MSEHITLFFPHCIIIHYCMASLDPASQKQSTTRLQVRSACSERQNRLAIYIVTGDARSPTANQNSLYTCVLVYICVVVSDYACMSVCACVSWQRNNYLKIVAGYFPIAPALFSMLYHTWSTFSNNRTVSPACWRREKGGGA